MISLYCAENRRAPFVDVFEESAREHGYRVRLVDPGPSPSTLYARFERAYRHYSVNSAGFELACFKRYFSAQRDMAAEKIFVMSDSDIVVQLGWDDMPKVIHCDHEQFVGSIGHSENGAEDDISPHFSRWTKFLLDDFVDFLIFQYEKHPDELGEIYKQRLKVNPRSSVSDMTLLNLWVKRRGIKFSNSNVLVSGEPLLDHNISTPWTANGRLRTQLGRKQLKLVNGQWCFIDAAGAPLQAATLHLQGRYKVVAQAIAQRQAGRLFLGSGYICIGRAARGIMHNANAGV